MMGMKYSLDARFELARRLSAIFQSPASNSSSPFSGQQSWLRL
jgi:hypothetical protein